MARAWGRWWNGEALQLQELLEAELQKLHLGPRFSNKDARGGRGVVLAEEPHNHSRGAKPWSGQERQPLLQPHLQEDGSGGLGADILGVDAEFDMLPAEQVCLSLQFFSTTSS